MSFSIKSISEKDIKLGQGNMGSLVDHIWTVDRSDIIDMHLPDYTDESLDGEELLTITQDIKLKPGAYLKKWYFTPGTGQFSENSVGETDGKSQQPQISFFIPKNSKKVKSQIAYAQNASLVTFCKDANGEVMVVGTDELPAKFMEGGLDTGENYEARNGTRFVFQAPSRFGAYYYEGILEALTEGTALENTKFSSTAVDATAKTLMLNIIDNSTFFDNAEGTDNLNVIVKNTTKKVTSEHDNVGTRASTSASISIPIADAGDEFEIEVWFSDATGKISAKQILTATATA